MSNRPKVGLVLGSGSARGLAHIGVLQVLEEHAIPIDMIVGCSMGAMVGGAYACGSDLKMLGKLIDNIDNRIFLDFTVPRLGFMSGNRIKQLIDLLTHKKQFSDTLIPLYVMATDLLSGQSIVMNKGNIADAVRASISIPGIFHPVKMDNMILVDGAVSDRLPISVAQEVGAEIVIAVEVNYTHNKDVIINNTFDVILTSLDIIQKYQYNMIESSADILIKPIVGHFSPRDFELSQQLIELGREAALAVVEEIKEKIAAYNKNL